MSNEEQDLSKLDPGFEFDTLRDIANGIFWMCAKLEDLEATTDEQRQELYSIREEMSDVEQAFEMVKDLPLILRKQKELRELRAEIERKYMER